MTWKNGRDDSCTSVIPTADTYPAGGTTPWDECPVRDPDPDTLRQGQEVYGHMRFPETFTGIPELVEGMPVSARISAIVLALLIVIVALRLYRDHRPQPEEA